MSSMSHFLVFSANSHLSHVLIRLLYYLYGSLTMVGDSKCHERSHCHSA